MKALAPRAALAFRVATFAWLVGWYWKAAFFGSYLFVETFAIPLRDEAFPAWIQAPALSAATYALPAIVTVSLFVPRVTIARAASVVMVGSALFASIHIDTAADATFTTSLWVGLWIAWLAWNGERTDEAFEVTAKALAQGVVGVLFLGALVGKMTPEYASGEAFYQLYFASRDEAPYPLLRASIAERDLREVATWFSRIAIAVEAVLAASPLAPFRFTLIAGCIALVAMVLVSTFYLVSVLASIAGLLVAAHLLGRTPSARASLSVLFAGPWRRR